MAQAYKNTRTGAIIEVNCKIGGDWVPVTPEPAVKPKKTPVKKTTGRKKKNV